jgi:hypothetical protein
MAITASIGGSSGGFDWVVEYDDATRAVTTSATGPGFCLVTVQVTSAISRTIAYTPVGGGTTQNADLAARMAAADFHVTSDGAVVTLATGINPNQVSRIVGKSGQVVGGLPSSAEWRPV